MRLLDLKTPAQNGRLSHKEKMKMKTIFLLIALLGAFDSQAYISNNEVTTAKIKDAAVTRTKIASAAFIAPTVTQLLSTGTKTGSYFIVSTANATAGATYTNNSQTFTVLSTIVSGTVLYTSGAGAPQASGTLTKATGTGDSTITFSSSINLATYTVPTLNTVKYLKVKIAGAGGGGGGGNAATNGTRSLFGTSCLTAQGGDGGSSNTGGSPAGGAITNSGTCSGTTLWSFAGETGTGGGGGDGSTRPAGGKGGSSIFGAAGGGGSANGNGQPAKTNSGSGGGGGGSQSSGWGGASGGGSGGSGEFLFASPAATYYYAIGVKGVGGTASIDAAGGDGGDGQILIEEHYQ